MLASITSQLSIGSKAAGLRSFSTHHVAAEVQLFNQRWAGETSPEKFSAGLSAFGDKTGTGVAHVQAFNQRWADETSSSEFNATLSAASERVVIDRTINHMTHASDEAVAPYIKLLDQRWKGGMSDDDFTIALGKAAENFNEVRSKKVAMPATETVHMPFVEYIVRPQVERCAQWRSRRHAAEGQDTHPGHGHHFVGQMALGFQC